MSVVGFMNNQKKGKSPEKSVAKDMCKKKLSTPTKPAKSSTNSKIKALDQKWSERFLRLKAMLLARTLENSQQEPTFQTVKVTPMKPPPAGTIKLADPFIPPAQPVDRPQLVDRSVSVDRPKATDNVSTNLSCSAATGALHVGYRGIQAAHSFGYGH